MTQTKCVAGLGAQVLPTLAPQDLDSLSRAAGITLSAYRPEHVAARVAQAVEREGADSPAALAALLCRSTAARRRFRRAVAISVTGRFRDAHQFELLRDRIFPDLLAAGRTLRVWSAGCATGLELYSVAEVLRSLGALGQARLLGSDLIEENIEVARRGGGDGRVLPVEVAARIRWEVRDLLSGAAPQGSFDLVVCRNVGIYFTREARARLRDLLAAALTPGGVLLLGRSERLTDPRRLGLEPYAAHAYRRAA